MAFEFLRPKPREGVRPSAVGFVLNRLAKAEGSIDQMSYKKEFDYYISRRKMDPEKAQKQVEGALNALIRYYRWCASLHAPLATIEVGTTIVGILTKSPAIYAAGYAVYSVHPLQTLRQYVRGEKKMPTFSRDKFLELMRGAVTSLKPVKMIQTVKKVRTLSPSNKLIDHLLKAYRMEQFLVLHHQYMKEYVKTRGSGASAIEK